MMVESTPIDVEDCMLMLPIGASQPPDASSLTDSTNSVNMDVHPCAKTANHRRHLALQ
jgi:hypothetical protein